jgi:hypothetical protein
MLGADTGQALVTPATSGFLSGKTATVGLAGLALLGGLLFFASRNHRAAPIESNAASRAATAISADAPLALSKVAATVPALPQPESVEALSAPSLSSAVRADVRPLASHHVRDNLSEEVAILSRAETALHSGKPEAALKLLNEHERKFGNGLLAEERVAARVQALCALGRTAEADAQMAQLSPKSLHGQQARKACGSR